MSRNRYLLTLGLSAAIALGAAGSAVASASHSSAHSSSAVLKVAKVSVRANGKTSNTSALVNSSGRAVYMLSGDSTKHPECTSQSCLGSWPAVTSSAKHPALGSGVSGKLTVWKHKGIDQLVLAGHPLYTYAGDPGADVADGQGQTSFGGTWKVVGGSGAAASVASTSGSGSSGGGW